MKLQENKRLKRKKKENRTKTEKKNPQKNYNRREITTKINFKKLEMISKYCQKWKSFEEMKKQKIEKLKNSWCFLIFKEL